MSTKEVNVVMNFMVPKSYKSKFAEIAYGMGTNPTNLMRMFIADTINKKRVSFGMNKQVKTFENVDIEPLDINMFSDNFRLKTEEYTRELKRLLSKK